jgi:hypothetical protein
MAISADLLRQMDEYIGGLVALGLNEMAEEARIGRDLCAANPETEPKALNAASS